MSYPPFTILSTCKGGGYRYCRTDPPHPNANSNGLYPLHRVLMENHLGRLLSSDEHVHHKDENKSNDVIENYELLTNAEHARRHAAERAVEAIELVCPACKAEFTLAPNIYRLRLKRSSTGQLGCSRRCGNILSHLGPT